MLPDGTLIPLATLGAVLGLDVVSFPQAMLSRPIVAATLAGAVLGNPLGGLTAGATLELFALETLPVGASRYPEWGSAAVVGGALFAREPDLRAGALLFAVLAAIATAWVGGQSMVLLRRLNAQLARAQRDRIAAGSARHVVGLQLAGLGFDLLRGFLMAVVALGVWSPAMGWLLPEVGASPAGARAVTVGLAAMVAGGAVWKLVHAVPRARGLFLGGLGIGLVLMVMLEAGR
jgi:PTS system mannose-specific IIC component